MKRIISLILALTALFLCSVPAFAGESTDGVVTVSVSVPDFLRDVEVDSRGAYLYNIETGTKIWSKAENKRMYPASTTKIMTAIIVLESCEDPKNSFITVDDKLDLSYIIKAGGANMSMKKGETFCVYDLLVGMMVTSFCDAAEVLAYEFGGKSVSAFVGKMNEKAKSLGLADTHFANPHGLNDKRHYSTVGDMTKIMEYAVKNPDFVEIIKHRDYTVPKTNKSSERKIHHTVKALYKTNKYYADFYVGGKSGFTGKAGRCLVMYTQKDGASYILTLFGANLEPSREYTEHNMTWSDAYLLLDYAYRNFEVSKFVSKNGKLGEIKVADTDTVLDVISPEDVSVFKLKNSEPVCDFGIPKEIDEKNVSDGLVLGHLELLYGEETYGEQYPVVLLYDSAKIKTNGEIDIVEIPFDDSFGEEKALTVIIIALVLLVVFMFACVKILMRI